MPPDDFAPRPGAWRTFSLITDIRLENAGGGAQLWAPVPAFTESVWMRPGKIDWQTNATSAELIVDPHSGAKMLHAQWKRGGETPALRIESVVLTRDRFVDFSRPDPQLVLSDEEQRRYTAPTKLQPTDGLVKTTADSITRGAQSDREKAQRIYEWIVENSYRKPATRGCGLGDVTFMLQTGDLGGKCADINGLNVALLRAAGIPARDVYGIRVAASQFSYHSLRKLADRFESAALPE